MLILVLTFCMLIWVPSTVPTQTPYSVKVFSFLTSNNNNNRLYLKRVKHLTVVLRHWRLCGPHIYTFIWYRTCYSFTIYYYYFQLVLPFIFIYWFHFIVASLYLFSFWWLYRRQLLYCCPPRIAQLIVGNIVLKYFTEYVKVCEMISATLTFHGPLTPELREVLGYTYF